MQAGPQAVRVMVRVVGGRVRVEGAGGFGPFFFGCGKRPCELNPQQRDLSCIEDKVPLPRPLSWAMGSGDL